MIVEQQDREEGTEQDSQDLTPVSKTPVANEPVDEGSFDLEEAEKKYDQEIEEEKQLDENEWGLQDINNAATGMGAGVARAVTSTIGLAADLGDLAAKGAGFEGFEDKTLADIHDTLDISDNLSDITGADPESGVFKTSRAISEGIMIGLQLMTGIGAAKVGAKVSTAILKKGGLKGAAKLASKGAKEVAKGSKKEVAGKVAAVGVAEEVISEENANEGGLIVDMIFRDAAEAEAQADEIHDGVSDILARGDGDMSAMADEYLALNPKSDSLAYDRLVNRLEGSLDGLVFGTGIAVTGKLLGKYFKAYKQTKVNAQVAKDLKHDTDFVAKKVDEKILKGEEVTDEFKEQAKKEAKDFRKAEKAKEYEEIEALYDEKIFGEKGVLAGVRERVAKTTSIFGNEDAAAIFEKASKGEVLSSSEIKAFRKIAKDDEGILKLTKMTREKFLRQSDKQIAEIIKDKEVLQATQKNFVEAKLVVAQERDKLATEMGSIKQEIFELMKDPNAEIPSRLILSQQAILAGDAALDLKSSAMNSLGGQFLNLAKRDKMSVAAINRNVQMSKKKFGTDLEFAEHEAKMWTDKEYMEAELAKRTSSKTNADKLRRSLDFAHDVYKLTLLTTVKSPIRNIAEGIALSAARITRDAIADPVNVLRAVRKSYTRDNTRIAFSAVKKAFAGEVDYETTSKMGASLIQEYGASDSGLIAGMAKAMTTGRRLITAGDKLVSTYNEAYFMNKAIGRDIQDMAQNSDAIENLANKLRREENLTPKEVSLSNSLAEKGIEPQEIAKRMEEGGIENAINYASESMKNSKTLKEGAKKYANTISMNMDTEDMDWVAKAFSAPVNTLSKTPLLRTAFPFPRPALSSLNETIEWTPFANLPRLSSRIKNGTKTEAREAIVQGALTMAGGAVLWDMFTEGILIGNGPEDKVANKIFRKFNKPQTLKVGNDFHSISGTTLGSVVNIIGEAHDFMESHDDGSPEAEKNASDIVGGLVDVISSVGTSFWTESLSSLIDLTKDGTTSQERALAKLVDIGVKSTPVLGLATQISKQVKDATEEEQSDTSTRTGDDPLGRAWNEFKKNMVFMDVPKRVSFITGEKLHTGATWKKPVLSLSSFKGTEHKDVGDYLTALMQESGEKTSRTSRDYLRFTDPERRITSTKFTGVEVSYPLSADEYQELSQLTAHPTAFDKPMTDAIREIMEIMPIEEGQPKSYKDAAIILVKKVMADYKKAASEEFMLESEDYQAWAREERVGEVRRQGEDAQFNVR